MFRFIIILLLVNASYHSSGHPIDIHNLNESNNQILLQPLAKSLQALADRCANPFLVAQIKHNIKECNLNEFGGTQMKCTIFYDISTQLCDAVKDSKLVLQNDLINELQKVVKVDFMCNSAQQWKFTSLAEYPDYKAQAETIFKNPLKCQKVCDVFDITSDDSNLFCKYFKWGSEVLKVQSSTPLAAEKSANNKIVAAIPDQQTITDTKPTGTLLNNLTVISTANNIVKADTNLQKDFKSSKVATTLTSVERPQEGIADKVVQTSSSNTAISGVDGNQNPVKEIRLKENQLSPIEVSNVEVPSAIAVKPDISSKAEIEKTILDEEEQPPKKIDVEKEDQILNSQNKEIKDSAVDDIGDDPDSEEDDKQDLQDDSEISIGKGDLQKIEEKLKENFNSVPVRTTYIEDKMPENSFSKTPQEDYPEDDDHFFSFFLTAVIIVVFLYILYHNKSKFTKVILGLIVEGRQPGRRRNSRGHAYRRLDTLEQAMSSNNPAPPSKIIY